MLVYLITGSVMEMKIVMMGQMRGTAVSLYIVTSFHCDSIHHVFVW